MPWSTPVIDGDDLFSLAAGKPLRSLIDEINARIVATGFTASTICNGSIVINAGDDATTLKLWNSFTVYGTYVTAIDACLFGNGGSGGGNGGLLALYQMPGQPAGTPINVEMARQYLGLPIVLWQPIGTPGYSEYRYMRRKRYRRLSNNIVPYASKTADELGNAATAGQFAYDFEGNLWRCIASGNWVRDAGNAANILDNTLAPPNTVPEFTASFYGTNPLRPEGWYGNGQVQPGDILGPWVFEERRQILGIMTVPL